MKKLIALFLAVLCVCALCSCGTSAELDELAESIYNAEGVSAEATITIESDDGSTQEYTSELYSRQDDKTGKFNSLEIGYYLPFTFDSNSNAVLPNSTTGVMTAGQPDADADEITLNNLTFNKRYFKDKKYTISSTSFEATIVNPTAFFGTTINIPEIEIRIRRGPYGPRNITLSYTTNSGSDVTIDIAYKYE